MSGEIISRPQTPGVNPNSAGPLKPAEYLPEMATIRMADEQVKQMGQPAIVSKSYIVWQGLWLTLNHSDKNKTGYDCTLRNGLYAHVEKKSVNVDGNYFNRLWQWLMRPHYVITQNALPYGNAFDKQEPGFFRRLINRVTGGGQEANNGGQ